MGRKKSSEKENKTMQLYKNPEMVDKDTVGMSAHFWDRFFAPGSQTRKWSPLQHTLFILVLGRIKDWRRGGNSNVVVLKNENIMKELGWDFSDEYLRSVGQVLRNELDEMIGNSKISLQDAETGKWYSGNLIFEAYGDSSITKVALNPRFMCHFEDLFYFASNYQKAFYQVSEPDIASFKCKYTYPLYQDLKNSCMVKNSPVEKVVVYGVNELKTLLGLDEKDYMRVKDLETQKYTGFDYASFEKKVLKPAIDEINCSELVEILPWDDGKFFAKRKHMRRVDGYAFKFKVYDLEAVRKERKAVYNAAIKAGKNPQFAPDYKAEIVVDANWKPSWSSTTDNTVVEMKDIDNSSQHNERRDKIGRQAKELFTDTDVPSLARPITKSKKGKPNDKKQHPSSQFKRQ